MDMHRRSSPRARILLVAALAYATLAGGCQRAAVEDRPPGPPAAVEVPEVAPADQPAPDDELQVPELAETGMDAILVAAPAEVPREMRPPTLTMAQSRQLREAIAPAQQGALAAAQRNLEALESDPSLRPYARHNRAVLIFAEGRQAAAERLWEEVLEEEPSYAAPLAALVTERLRQGDRAGARSLVARQMQRSEGAATVEAIQLFVLLDEGRYEDIIRQSRSILFRDELNMDVYVALAHANHALGRAELAGFIIEEGLSREPAQPALLLLRARMAEESGQRGEAIAALRRAIRADGNPLHPTLRLMLSRLLMEERQAEEAESVLRPLLALPRYPADTLLNLGAALRMQGRYDEALRFYDQANDRGADPQVLRFNLAVLHLEGDLPGLTRQARLERGIELLTAFIEGSPDLPETHPARDYLAEAATSLRLMTEVGGGRRGSQRPARPAADPFGGGESDPFGGDESDPFGGDESDPFGGDESDPFAD